MRGLRVFGSIERLRRRQRRENRAGGEDLQPALGVRRLVRVARAGFGAHRPRRRAIIAMALRGDAQGGLAVELLEMRHVRMALQSMPVKTDRNDARDMRGY